MRVFFWGAEMEEGIRSDLGERKPAGLRSDFVELRPALILSSCAGQKLNG